MLAEYSRYRLAYAFLAGVFLWLVGNFLLFGLGLSADDKDPLWENLMFTIPLWGAQLAVCLIWAGREWMKKLGISFSIWDFSIGTLLGVIAQLAVVIVYLPFLPILDLDKVSEPARDLYERASDSGHYTIALMAIFTVLIAPIVEEVFFRGFVQSALANFFSRRFGRKGEISAIILASAIFAAIHLQLIPLLGLFFIGLLLGYVRYRTKRIGLCICIHAGFNLLAFVSLI